MSHEGHCWVNDVTESFLGSPETESARHEQSETRVEAKIETFERMEAFYNRARLHSVPGLMSPEQCERQVEFV